MGEKRINFRKIIKGIKRQSVRMQQRLIVYWCVVILTLFLATVLLLSIIGVLPGMDFKVREMLSAQQKNGKPLGADIVYKETWLWLKQRGCEKHVNKRLLESYSQAFARFVQCEEALSTYGLLGKHPTTGGVIASPFVQMSQTFQKQANLLWYEIFDIVKQNCTTKFDGTPQDDLMEQLLSSRK